MNNREYDSLNKEIEFQNLEVELAEKKIRDAEAKIEFHNESKTSTQETLMSATKFLKKKEKS